MSDQQMPPANADDPHAALHAGIDQIWTVYQRFRSLGASESEAVALAEALMKGVMASVRAGVRAR